MPRSKGERGRGIEGGREREGRGFVAGERAEKAGERKFGKV